MRLCSFTNISSEILEHILHYIFCAKVHILMHVHQMFLPLKAIINQRKVVSALAPKVLMKPTLDGSVC
jgi:hypothetical protein